jgi:hypothetical protein
MTKNVVVLLFVASMSFGQGSPGFIAKFHTSTTVNNSLIFQNTAGNIGVATSTPTDRFQVNSGDFLVRGPQNFLTTGNVAHAFVGDHAHYVGATWGKGLFLGTYKVPVAMFVQDTTGRIGIGTITPQANLDVTGTKGMIVHFNGGIAGSGTGLVVDAFSNGLGNGLSVSAYGFGASINADFGDGLNVFSNHGAAAVLGSMDGDIIDGTSAVGHVFHVDSNGKVTAAGGFNGRCLNTGAFGTSTGNACNMDLAETYDSAQRTEPGELVSLDPSAEAKVRKSAKRYEPLLLGVVSTNPGLVFDAGKTHLAGDNSGLVTKDKTVVALVGRVPVKVSMENGPIRVGDPLTSSSKPGIAMKATAAGKIIGYALASANKAGKVPTFVQPGYYASPQLALLKAKFARLHHDNVKLHAENVTLRDQFLGLAAQIKQIRAQLDSDQSRSAKLVGLNQR